MDRAIKVTVIDVFEEHYDIFFKRHEYANLMELIINTYYEEIGECGGRGLCGTCIVSVVFGRMIDKVDFQERHTLSVMNKNNPENRLACQIMLDESIDQFVFRIEEPC